MAGPPRPDSSSPDSAPEEPEASSPGGSADGGDAKPLDEPSTLCPNCGATRPGAYCSQCGQKAQTLRQPTRLFIANAFQEYIGVDSRLWSSLGLLLFKPGTLTKRYLSGQRERYIRPLRLYITTTLTFFFMISVFDPVGRMQDTLIQDDTQLTDSVRVSERIADLDSSLAAIPERQQRLSVLVDSLEGVADSLQQVGAAADSSDTLDTAVTDSIGVQIAAEVMGELGSLNDDLDDARDDYGDFTNDATRDSLRLAWQREQLARMPPDSLIDPADVEAAAQYIFEGSGSDIEVNVASWLPEGSALRDLKAARTDEQRNAALMDLIREVVQRLPTVMFVMLPVFALLLKLIYVRHDWFYSEHLVFGLHTHTFAFSVFTVVALLVMLGLGMETRPAALNWLINRLPLVIPVYFVVAQRRVYRQGWIKTLLKAGILGCFYSLVLSLGLILAVLLALSIG